MEKSKSSRSMSFEDEIKLKSRQLASSSSSTTITTTATTITTATAQDRHHSRKKNMKNKSNVGINTKHRTASVITNQKSKLQKTTSHKDENNSTTSRIPSPTNAPKPSSTTSSTATATISLLQKPKQYIIKFISNPILQKFLTIPISILIFILFKKVFLGHHSLEYFFTWMEQHPNKGMAAYLFIYPFHMLLFIPGTPLVMGAGYIFTIRFGWLWGVCLCSIISLLGSLIGSMMCFLLARYCIRGTVRRWSKNYPMFEPIDAAVSDNGFKIMTLLYLTPVMPLGPLSYVMGTTSMPLMSFAKAKIAALPLTVLYVYLGAATGTLIAASEEDASDGQDNSSSASRIKMGELKVDPKLIVFGILCSICSIAFISIKMKQELQKILDKQNDDEDGAVHVVHDDHLSKVKVGKKTGKTRQRHKAPRVSKSTMEDIELQRPLVSS